MIRVIARSEQDLTAYSNPELYGAPLSEGVLIPTECTVTEEAGGNYTLSLKHPIDPEGRWKLIQPLGLICAPIPTAETPAIDPSGGVIGAGSEVWITTTSGAYLYGSKPRQYKQWKSGEGYYPGDRVTHNSYNWECVQITLIEPSAGASAWRSLGPCQYVVKVLPQNTLLVVSSKDATYLTCVLLDGTSGLVRISAAEYQYTIEEGASIIAAVDSRILTHQCFRVTSITMDGRNMSIQVNAQHVSYDYNMILVDKTTLRNTPLQTAIAAVRSAVLPDGASSAPNIFAENTENTVTAACTRKTLTSVILDPEEGLVPQARARLVRDEHDFFLLEDTEIDRGYTIRYGVNLTGVTWSRDFSKLVTRVLPVAKAANGSDYTNPTTPYVDSNLRDSYPIDMYEAISVDAKIGTDGTEQEVQAKMIEEGEKVFNEQHADLPVTTLTVEFLMLGDTEEYAQYRGLERLSLYDTVEIVHPDLGLSTRAQVKSYEWDAINRRYIKITLGDAFEAARHTVYGYSVGDATLSAKKLTPEAIAEIRGS